MTRAADVDPGVARRYDLTLDPAGNRPLLQIGERHVVASGKFVIP